MIRRTGPLQPALDRLDPLLRTPVSLTDEEIGAIVEFVRNGLLDPAAQPQKLRRLIPEKLPSTPLLPQQVAAIHH